MATTPHAPLRFGVLGAAAIAPDALITPAADHPGVRVDLIAARDRLRAEAFAAEHGIERVADDYAAVVDDPDIDVVFVPLPMSLHAEWTIRALEAGKHVLCEKPFASNATEARSMVAAAARNDRRLVEAFHWRYHPLADRITAEVATLGALRRGSARFNITIADRDDIRWRWDTSGGSLMDLGCYPVQWARHVFGPTPTVTRASATTLAAEGIDPRIDAAIEATLDFGDGIECTVSSSMVTEGFEIDLVVEGDRGVLTVRNPLAPHHGHRIEVETASGTRTETVEGRSTYSHQLDAFVDHVNFGTPVPTGGDDAIQTMATIDAIYTAAGLPPRAT